LLIFCEGEKLSDEDLNEILEEADRDGDGMISFEEFYRFLNKKNNNGCKSLNYRVMKKRDNPIDDLDSDNEKY